MGTQHLGRAYAANFGVSLGASNGKLGEMRPGRRIGSQLFLLNGGNSDGRGDAQAAVARAARVRMGAHVMCVAPSGKGAADASGKGAADAGSGSGEL